MAASQGEGHVTAVRSPDHCGAGSIQAVIFRQALQGKDVVQAVLPAPIPVDLLGIAQAVTGRAAVRLETRLGGLCPVQLSKEYQ